MKSKAVMSDSTASMSETSLSILQPNCDAEDVAGKTQEEVQDSKNSSSSAEQITTQTDDGSHHVTWTVYIALAVPSGEEFDAFEPSKSTMKTQKTPEADSCYHVECNLLPGDTETAKVDLEVFGPAAKMYTGNESKILRTWHEGDQRWIGWAQSFHVRVSKDMLTSLLPHKIRLQIWNHRKRLRAVTQNECEEAPDMHGGVDTMVKRMRSLCAKKSWTCGEHTETSSEPGKNWTPPLKTDVSSTEDITNTSTARMEMSPACFLAGDTSLTESFAVCSAGVFEVMCNISLDKPLLSEQLKVELNPLVITILSATSMPSSPVPFHVLQERCLPVYCQYKFHSLRVHRTNYHKHGAKIHFRDVNVILTGLMCPEELQEFLCGPPMEIEVHDCDLKLKGSPTAGSASCNATTAADSPYGAAFFNLSQLLYVRSIKSSLPIKCCPPPSLLQRPMSEAVADGDRMLQGRYYEANSQLKVKADIACPLGKYNSCERPFRRIVYLIGRNNSAAMMKLRSEILMINATAFWLDSCPLEAMDTALSNYSKTFKHDGSKDLDFVSGFHVLNETSHIFVLEGLRDKAVRKLWETVPMKPSENEDERVIVLYNSGLGFFKRIYGSLNVSLSPVQLQEPLENIMRNSQIYIQGATPQLCFQALTRLSQLSKTRCFRDVVQYNLFPSADMILSLMKLYGSHNESWMQMAEANAETTTQPTRTKTRTPLDMYNAEYVRWKRLQKLSQHNFVQRNIEKVREESEQLQKTEAVGLRMDQAADAPAHNYSIQTFNSNVLTMKLLQKEMAKMPGRRWTYSQQYLSATVEPGDVASTSHLASASGGWVTEPSRSTTHPKHPDEARVEELRRPWRENVLHANILKPTLPRDVWPWSRRSEDFQLYKKPPTVFSTAPISIDLAGETLQQEQLQAARAQFHRWWRKLLPDSPAHAGRIPEFKCHMRGNSDRTQGLLKDEPRKYSLQKPGLMLKPLPQLSVLNLGNRVAEEKLRAALAPGPCPDCRLGSKNNAVPRHAASSSKHPHTKCVKQKSFLYKRTPLPLTDEERITFTFKSTYPTQTLQPFHTLSY